MDIVIEGTDNAGKSWLAEYLQKVFGQQLVKSEGPEKYEGEINQRVERYLAMPREGGIIFDRHPCVSQLIYGQLGHNTPVREDLMSQFYGSKPLFIYCRPVAGRGLEGHIEKAHDSAEHIAAVRANYDKLLQAYDAWALQYARVMYRIGDAPEPIWRIVNAIQEYAA